MLRRHVIALALVASFGLHVALLLLTPGLQLRLPISRETLVEVEVAPLSEEPAPEPEPAPPPEPAAVAEPQTEPVPAPLPVDAVAVLQQALGPWSAASALPPAKPPPLQLPRRDLELPGADTIAWSASSRPATEPLPAGNRYHPATELPPGPDQELARTLSESLLQDLAATVPESATPALAPPLRLEIEGPVGRERQVLERPPPPSVKIHHSVDVRLKFFVSPRGEVLRAFPIERGGSALDRAALAYLRQFRFSALPHGDQREQWGTIRFRFRLE